MTGLGSNTCLLVKGGSEKKSGKVVCFQGMRGFNAGEEEKSHSTSSGRWISVAGRVQDQKDGRKEGERLELGRC